MVKASWVSEMWLYGLALWCSFVWFSLLVISVPVRSVTTLSFYPEGKRKMRSDGERDCGHLVLSRCALWVFILTSHYRDGFWFLSVLVRMVRTGKNTCCSRHFQPLQKKSNFLSISPEQAEISNVNQADICSEEAMYLKQETNVLLIESQGFVFSGDFWLYRVRFLQISWDGWMEGVYGSQQSPDLLIPVINSTTEGELPTLKQLPSHQSCSLSLHFFLSFIRFIFIFSSFYRLLLIPGFPHSPFLWVQVKHKSWAT